MNIFSEISKTAKCNYQEWEKSPTNIGNAFPPDKQKLATENILKQAELFADEWSI